MKSALAVLLASLVAASGASASGGGAGLGGATAGGSAAPGGSGGVPIGALDPKPRSKSSPKTKQAPRKLVHGKWMTRVSITEYWPAPESWFVGALVSVPGLSTKHRIDWLYSAMGVSMEGEGFGLDGRMYHIDALGDGGWVTASGRSTDAGAGWSGGSPFWRAGGFWKNSSGAVTFPLHRGGWYHGRGRRYVPLPHVTFAPGASLPLHFYQSIAVDPSVIPLGSEVYVPAYAHDGHGGWFTAQDTGGAITGHHIDVYRNPPASSSTSGQYLTNQRMYVIPPRR
jgi:3D (Asp-Asp-Asp) domain-containing protein